jgi:hypothetical protein
MTFVKLAPLTVLATLVLSACGAGKTEDASAVLDVPSIQGSIAEFVDRGGPFSTSVIRLAVMGDGQVAWFQSEAGAPEAFVKYVATLGTGVTGNIRAFSAEGNLAQADTMEQLERINMGAIPCTGQEANQSLILRRAGGHSTLAVAKTCGEFWNPALLESGYPGARAMEIDNLYQNLQSLRYLAARR